MKITNSFLEAGKSVRGGWNSYQVGLLGLTFPLPKRWKKKLIGKEITRDTWDLFIAAKGQSKAQKTNAEKSGPVVYLNPKTYEVQEKALTKVRAMYIASGEFLKSYEWRSKRMEAIKLHGARCQCCGATPKDGVRINVDHIQPRKTHPELALDLNNLQVLCEECNHGKGNWDNTDWRE